jgi:L-amino acid N-acyltransferase YncA
MVIREASLADAAAIAHVHVDSWRTTYRRIIPDEYLAKLSYDGRTRFWERRLAAMADGEFAYVAEDEAGQIVGIAVGGPERSGDPVYQGELCGIYLLESHQRQGIGRQLTLTIVVRLAQAGIHSMLVWVLAENPSRRFYEALGGQVIRQKPIEIGGVTLDEVAYGWTDTRLLQRAGRG